MQGEVLSNVIGAPFNQYIIDQLNIRAALGSSQNRTDQQVLYLANKMSWTRLSSSIRVKPANGQPLQKFYANLFDGQLPPGDYSNADSLAKNWVLEAGTSRYNNGGVDLRYGLGPDGAYGIGGIEQQGYRPMPGIDSVTIESKGTLGSLREANIKFSVWNMVQLNVIEALYFRLGYTMLLEWGHVNYFNNNGQFITDTFGLDIFSYNNKEQIAQAITKRNKETSGNYDAMLGTVTNFYFAFNEQGGFDCNVKLIGLGSIIDTLKINQTFVMPSSLFLKVQQAQEVVEADRAKQEAEAKIAADKQARTDQGLVPVLPSPVTNLASLKVAYNAYRFGKYNLVETGVTFTGTANFTATTKYYTEDYYFKATEESAASNAEFNNKRFGLFLASNGYRGSSWLFIPADLSQPQVKLNFDNLEGVAQNQGYKANLLQYDTVTLAPTPGALYPTKGLWTPTKGIATTAVGQLIDSSLSSFNSGLFDFNRPPFSGTIYESAEVTNTFAVIIAYVLRDQQKFIRFQFSPAQGLKHTRKEYVTAIEDWLKNSRIVNLTDIAVRSLAGNDHVFFSGNIVGLKVGNDSFTGIINSNDTGLIQSVIQTSTTNSPIPAPTTSVDPQGETKGAENQADATQTEQESKFNSALHAMLTAVKALGQAEAIGKTQAVIPIDLTESTNIFYQYGILKDVLTQAGKTVPPLGNTDFDLTSYALKGFNSNLMADKSKFASINPVNYSSLCTAYYVGYEFKDNENMTATSGEKPVYIKLGYLLAFLNNMCLLYETIGKKSGAKGDNLDTIKPYVYIDFHPDYNFCLTAPQHMTVDPYKCFIPLNATDSDYLKLFDSVGAAALKEVAFKPSTENTLSKSLNAFKTDNAYQGKTMEILLNTQYLLNLANQFVQADKEATIALKPFLDKLMEDLNKSTGGFNLFRVAYRDDSNTIIIKDDQWTPPLPQETSAIDKSTYVNNRKYMELQIFGSGSLVRDMEFKTNMSTKMSSMIAISAQAVSQSANGVDSSPIGTYNTNYEDAFMPIKQNASTGSAVLTSKQVAEKEKEEQQLVDTNSEAAKKFNAYVKSVYYEGQVVKQQTNFAINYFLDRFRIRKAEDHITTAAPFIPANLSITVDGISGIVMGNAFGIPESRLPASLRGYDGITKVGFTVVGLSHILEKNEWTTKIRGQMIKLRDVTRADTAKVTGGDAFTYPPITIPNDGTVSSTIKGSALYNDATFRAGLKVIADKYQVSDLDLLKIMKAECNLNPSDSVYVKRDESVSGPLQIGTAKAGYELFATGLLQFTKDNLTTLGASSLEQIRTTSAVGQLPFVDKYLGAYTNKIRGGDIYTLYTAVFFPAFITDVKNRDVNKVFKYGKVSAERISEQNPAIARAAGKTPGTALTIGDFIKYVSTIV